MIDKLARRATGRAGGFAARAERRAAQRAGAAQQEVSDRRIDGRLRALRRRASRAHFDHVRIRDARRRQRPARARARAGRSCMRRAMPAKVNLIPFNPFPGTRFERSRRTRSARFQQMLHRRRHVATIVRKTRGDDIDAACGQLKGQVMDRTRRQAEFRKTLRATGSRRCGCMRFLVTLRCWSHRRSACSRLTFVKPKLERARYQQVAPDYYLRDDPAIPMDGGDRPGRARRAEPHGRSARRSFRARDRRSKPTRGPQTPTRCSR